MPTETNKSPLTLPPALIGTAVKGVAGGLGGAYTAGLGEIKQIKEEFKEKDFKNQKFGKKLGMLAKAGLRTFGAYQQGMLGGTIKGITGSDMGIGSVGLLADNQPGAQSEDQPVEQPTYRTNIDPMTGEEILPNQDLVNKYGIPMAGKPIKALTQMQGTVAHNMSAAQYKSAIKMSEISGASTLPSPVAKMANKDYDGDGKIESSEEEYLGSRDNAIKENKK